ncbi:MAG: hypothetical protein MZV64_10625 [Ignavibacteriales bacterium]|nr:hypothetical protein [Ignavibacteriales bacterium]
MHGAKVIGVLEVVNKTVAGKPQPEGFTPGDQQTLRGLSDHMAIAMAKLNLIQYDRPDRAPPARAVLRQGPAEGQRPQQAPPRGGLDGPGHGRRRLVQGLQRPQRPRGRQPAAARAGPRPQALHPRGGPHLPLRRRGVPVLPDGGQERRGGLAPHGAHPQERRGPLLRAPGVPAPRQPDHVLRRDGLSPRRGRLPGPLDPTRPQAAGRRGGPGPGRGQGQEPARAPARGAADAPVDKNRVRGFVRRGASARSARARRPPRRPAGSTARRGSMSASTSRRPSSSARTAASGSPRRSTSASKGPGSSPTPPARGPGGRHHPGRRGPGDRHPQRGRLLGEGRRRSGILLFGGEVPGPDLQGDQGPRELSLPLPERRQPPLTEGAPAGAAGSYSASISRMRDSR